MPVFQSEGFALSYDVYGEGKPIVAVHGFGSSGAVNWLATGWVETLTKAGYQVITLDNRGHGASEKSYDPDVYGAPTWHATSSTSSIIWVLRRSRS